MSDITDAIGMPFDPSSVPPAEGSFEPMPPNWYVVHVDSAIVEDNRKKTGKVLKLELTVLTEGFNGRKVWSRINLSNPNSTTTEIGHRELSALGTACGLTVLQDCSELTGNTVEARLKVEPPRVNQETGVSYDASNVVTSYRSISGAQPAVAPAAVPAPTVAPPAPEVAPVVESATAGAAKRPWE